MAEKKYYWLKLQKDFFKRHDIRIIEGMDNGKDYVLFYLKLLLESIDHEGALRFSETIPYNEKMLATITNTNIDIVRSAMEVFTQLGMIEVLDDATIFMAETNKMFGCETKYAEKKRNQRNLPKLENGSRRLNGEMLLLADGTRRYIDEKRYGGNGMLVMDRAGGKCEICGSDENVVIHHNNGYSNEPNDLIVLCSKCHGKAHSKEHGGEIVPPMSTTCPLDVRQELEKELKKDIKCVEEILYQLGTESITHTQYNELICRFSKDMVEEVINRILTHPYHGCLNVETIAKWCEETKNRPKPKQTKNRFNNFNQRKYSQEQMDEIERMILTGSS